MNIAVSETVLRPPTLDQEADAVESDNDVPNYSDIETMILDMDLDPDDQDSYSSEEVSKYQLEETNRAIIRLEQGAHSYMERAIASLCNCYFIRAILSIILRDQRFYLVEQRKTILLTLTWEEIYV